MKHGALARKRHRKIMKRRWVRRVKNRMYCQFGAFIGSQMYRRWRDSVVAKAA